MKSNAYVILSCAISVGDFYKYQTILKIAFFVGAAVPMKNHSQIKHPSSVFKSLGVLAGIFLSIGWCVNSPSISAQLQRVPEDASGTLVMVTRTSTAVIVSVDSEVHALGPNSQDGGGSSDGNRKLILVGEKGACAIEGYLGMHGYPESDVSGYLRIWVRDHPTMGPYEGIDGLLQTAATAWNVSHPGGKRLDGDITYLTCGDIVGTQPFIVRGWTSDLAPGYEKVAGNDVLYVGGILNNDKFRAIFENPLLIEEVIPGGTQSTIPKYREASAEVKSDAAAMRSYKMSLAVVNSGVSSLSDSFWNLTTIQALFSSVYKAIEQNFSGAVGPPNNVRIVTPCGPPLSTTVETNPWPTCPSTKANAGSPPSR